MIAHEITGLVTSSIPDSRSFACCACVTGQPACLGSGYQPLAKIITLCSGTLLENDHTC